MSLCTPLLISPLLFLLLPPFSSPSSSPLGGRGGRPGAAALRHLKELHLDEASRKAAAAATRLPKATASHLKQPDPDRPAPRVFSLQKLVKVQ